MADSPLDRDPLDVLADEFASRCRAGAEPPVSEYVAKYPQFADRIEDLFPTVAMMERLRSEETRKRHAALKRNGSTNVPDRVGDFRIVREVGRGGMGIVFEAEQQSLGRRVAVKILPRHALLLDTRLKQFQREAQTAARLRHTNIVPVFGVGEHEGLHYYVMPLVQGVGLDELIRELRDDDSHASVENVRQVVQTLIATKFDTQPSDDSPTSYWRMVGRIGRQAADALDYAHSQGTLHRDIKPGNLLLDSNGVVCVADFGLASAVDPTDASRADEVVGTPRYMAPEQLQAAADARSEVFSLGLTLYELLTLESPSDRLAPIRPRRINPDIPLDLETIVLKCIEREPSKRYQTAAALAKDLRRFLEDRPIRARRVSWIERAWRWRRRNPALAAVSALAAVLMIAVGVIALTGYLRTKRAYAQTQQALTRSETTSQLALDVLDDIYLQLSPDRLWILSDVGAGGEVCACLGLRSSAGSISSTERAAMQVRASEETASLLKGLLIFYDRLAEQTGADARVMFQSAIASRRVGDIRQLLGQLDEAEEEYARAIKKLGVLTARPNAETAFHVELARAHNELGNVQSVRLESESAYASHRVALGVLQSLEPTGGFSAEYRYELARTLYLLANRQTIELGNRRGTDAASVDGASPSPRYSSRQCREAAVRILEQLAREDPNIPDYRFLLALCYRPSGSGSSESLVDKQARQQAIGILEELKTQFPEVDDYRYELAATHAWIHVGLFPWQEPTVAVAETEQSLLKALDESRWLVAHNRAIPHYTLSETLILAKLGSICWDTERLAEAEDYFQKAFETQVGAIAEFPNLPPHNRVLLEFMRLRVDQIHRERNIGLSDIADRESSRDCLETCIADLTELVALPELAEDRLAASCLPLAYEELSRVLAAMGEHEKAEEARKNGSDAQRNIRDGRKPYWRP